MKIHSFDFITSTQSLKIGFFPSLVGFMYLFKSVFTILFVIILSSCATKKSNNVIAYNHDKSIQLTQQALHDWLLVNADVTSHSTQTQIEAYFIQHALLAQKNILSQAKIDEIEFLAHLQGLRKARGKIKDRWKQTLRVDTNKVDELYRAYKDNYDNKVDKVRLYQIFKRFPPNASAEQKQQIYQQMVNIRASIHDLDSFKHIAQTQSNSQSRLRSGLIGNIGSGIFDADLEKIVLPMQKDELSEIIASQKGYLLFYSENRIAKVARTDAELYEIAYNNILSQQITEQWPHYLAAQEQKLNIQYAWDAIKATTTDDTVVIKSTVKNLNKAQLLWVLNEDINHYELSEFNQDTIEKRVSYYLLNQVFYTQLSPTEAQDMNQFIPFTQTNMLTTQILLKLIEDKFSPPSEAQLQAYYDENISKYQSTKTLDFSYIALNLAGKDKAQVYQQAEEILYRIQNQQLNFEQAVKLYNAPEKTLKGTSTGLITVKQSTQLFGINVNKQLRLLKENEVSDLVESDSGYVWILRLNQIQAPQQLSFQQAKHKVHQDLGNRLLNQHKEQAFAQLLAAQKITFNQ